MNQVINPIANDSSSAAKYQGPKKILSRFSARFDWENNAIRPGLLRILYQEKRKKVWKPRYGNFPQLQKDTASLLSLIKQSGEEVSTYVEVGSVKAEENVDCVALIFCPVRQMEMYLKRKKKTTVITQQKHEFSKIAVERLFQWIPAWRIFKLFRSISGRAVNRDGGVR